jgi:hypothetical protein
VGTYCVLHHRKARRIVAAFCQGDYLEFHEQRSRLRWTLPIDEAFRIAVRIKSAADRRIKKGGAS